MNSRLYVFILFGIFFTCKAYSQNTPFDTKKEVYKIQIKTLLDSSNLFIISSPLKSGAYLRKALEMAQQHKDGVLQADIYIELSRYYFSQNEPEQELNYVLKAKEIYIRNKNEKGISNSLIRLARIKLNSWKYDNVLEYLYDALAHAYNSKDSNQIALSYHYLGTAYHWFTPDQKPAQKLFFEYTDSAERYLIKAINIMTKTKFYELGFSYNNLGAILHRRAKITGQGFEDALDANRKALGEFQKRGNPRGIASSYHEIAKCLRDQNKYNEAINLLKKSIKIADSIKHIPQLENSYQDLYLTYYEIHNIDSSYKYFGRYSNIRLRQAQMQSKALLADQDAKYKTEKKEAQILLQTKELEVKNARLKFQKGVLIVSILVHTIFGGLSIFLYKLYTKNKNLSQKNALLLKEQNHRVKNNLQVISALLSLQANRIENTDARKAIEDSQLRVQAMGMIHKKLYGDNVVEIDMKTFIPELAECILPVFGYHNGSVHHLIETTVENLNVDKAVPVGLILNELLTNSCKYAFPKTEKPYFNIALLKNPDNTISLTFQDNGPGFDYEQANKKGSFGLKLIELQSRQIFGEYWWEINNGLTFSLTWKN